MANWPGASGRLRVSRDKNLVPCIMESVPDWGEDVGPAQVQTLVDRAVRMRRGVCWSLRLLTSRPALNLLANSQFIYFACYTNSTKRLSNGFFDGL